MKIIKRKSAVRPITGSIVDTTNIDDKTTNTYSARVIDGLVKDVYSTTEQVIGTYLGKPLYRKIVQATTPTEADHVGPMVRLYDLNIENVVDIRGVIFGAGMCWGVNANSNSSYYSVIYFLDHEKSIFGQVGSELVSSPCNIIIEYTKTTD